MHIGQRFIEFVENYPGIRDDKAHGPFYLNTAEPFFPQPEIVLSEYQQQKQFKNARTFSRGMALADKLFWSAVSKNPDANPTKLMSWAIKTSFEHLKKKDQR